MRKIKQMIFLTFMIFASSLQANQEYEQPLPPIEIFIVEPMHIENICVVVPAVKVGPLINRACRPKDGLSFSSAMPASIRHSKTERCPDPIARILACTTSFYYDQSLPLTIFNGWQWEYTYNLCQFESVSYTLEKRGGSWENCWQAEMDMAVGHVGASWLSIEPMEKINTTQKEQSDIEIITFSSMRTRDGYPKQRQL